MMGVCLVQNEVYHVNNEVMGGLPLSKQGLPRSERGLPRLERGALQY